jgi:hypothetical protein
MKKIFAFLLTLTLMFTNGIAVLAEEVETPPADQISSNPNYASYTWIAPLNGGSQAGTNEVGEDGLQIVMVNVSMGKSGSSVSATATTYTNINSVLGGTVYIQKWQNNKWNTVYSEYFVNYGACMATVTTGSVVESGYYYRVGVAHFAHTPYSSVFAYSTTQSVFVN